MDVHDSEKAEVSSSNTGIVNPQTHTHHAEYQHGPQIHTHHAEFHHVAVHGVVDQVKLIQRTQPEMLRLLTSN